MNLTGSGNTASGYWALTNNTTGGDNTAIGFFALANRSADSNNTAVGWGTLGNGSTGSNNTAVGSEALDNNTADNNTATGYQALYKNTTGFNNNAFGANALYTNNTGANNTAIGSDALQFNTTGSGNTGIGSIALNSNTIGANNTAMGVLALSSNTTGSNNTVTGVLALYANSTGSNNIAVGYQAGYKLTTSSNNIDIGNTGLASDNGAIRIGTGGSQKAVFIAGISNSKITGSAVYVTAGGRLGVLASSERYKTAIEPMGSNTAKLEQLRPVTFHLKTDPQGALQYGLIAEEVAKVYPELVIRDEKGRIEGVRYDELAPMLLNELQKQQQTIAAQAAQLGDMKQQLAEIRTALTKQPNTDRLVAQR